MTKPENVRYITGFSGSAGWGVLSLNKKNTFSIQKTLFTDTRYLEAWKQQGSCEGRNFTDLPKVFRPGMRVGIEANDVTLSQQKSFRKKFPQISWVQTTGVIEQLRRTKSQEEEQKLMQCANISKQAMEKTLPGIQKGMTEKEVAWMFEKYARESGADALAFPPIVAFGEHSACPHHECSDRRLQTNETVLLDFGVQKDGYHSDCTRTFFSGTPTKQWKKIWKTVFEAQKRGIQGVAPGKKVAEIDKSVRIFFGDNEPYFVHSLGHGVGLEIHEAPNLSNLSRERLLEGDIVTVEPGLYFPEKFGIRIEDFGIVTQKELQLFPALNGDWASVRLPSFR